MFQLDGWSHRLEEGFDLFYSSLTFRGHSPPNMKPNSDRPLTIELLG
jgi:hypothetical protein